jgi:DNA-binding transcriptional regulator YhcF (GntR family)
MRSRDELRKNQARAVSRMGGDYTLRTMIGVAAGLDHDYALAVVYMAILQANLAPLMEDPALSARYAAIDTIVPEDLRRPISVHALAGSLHMPYETTRRCVGRLIDKGHVKRISRSGILTCAERMADLTQKRMVEQQYQDTLRLVGQLRRGGIELEMA